MTQYTVNGQDIDVQAEKLDTQNFNRKTSLAPTKSGGITLSDDHLAVIMYLRKHYLELGPPIDPQFLARELEKNFSYRVDTNICVSCLPVDRLRKAAASPTCASRKWQPIIHWVSVINITQPIKRV